MAKPKADSTVVRLGVSRSKIRRNGVHSKKKNSPSKRSRCYRKKYVGQGR